MNGCLIILRSVTYAQRAKRVLERNGISAYVIKPEAHLVGNGCGFAVKVSDVYLAESLDILSGENFGIMKVYVPSENGYRELRV
ncbi:MAG: DUF3343 domain-containing protein [Clostridia bacterium]|nr:DUF3343 domain-containing protein [Clostridia bacterium]